jgi:hypothetical protein
MQSARFLHPAVIVWAVTTEDLKSRRDGKGSMSVVISTTAATSSTSEVTTQEVGLGQLAAGFARHLPQVPSLLPNTAIFVCASA